MSRAVRASGRSNRTCSGVTLQVAGRAVLAAKLGAAPRVWACAGSTARRPAAAMAQDMAWRRSTRWQYMAMRFVPVGSICYAFFSVALLPGLGIGRPQMGGVDDHGRNGTTDTIVHAMSEHIILTGGVEVKCAGVGPMPHDGKAVEQRDLVLLGHHAHVVGIGTERNHDVGARAVLHVHQDDVRAAAV